MKKIIQITFLTIGIAMGLFGKDLLNVGEKAPEFSLKTASGAMVTLSQELKKHNVVLIFYPGDNTPGCTSQLCAVRDDWSDFQDAGVQVFGVNPADAASHNNFSEKYEYPFPLLVDTNKAVAKAYNTEGAIFISRSVVGIDRSGTIVFSRKGKPANGEILKAFVK